MSLLLGGGGLLGASGDHLGASSGDRGLRGCGSCGARAGRRDGSGRDGTDVIAAAGMSQLSLFIWLSVTFGVIPPIFNSTRVDGINADDL